MPRHAHLLLALAAAAIFSAGSVSANDDSCRYHGDGECDEPRYCSTGTDCTDCHNCNAGDPCRYHDDGECDVPQYCSSGDSNDCGSSSGGGGGGDAPALDNTSVGDFVLHIAGCLFSGVMSMISSVFTMLDMLNSVSDSSLMTVCNGIVSRLEGAGTSRCDPGTLCGATGLLAEECDAIFMAVCILSDDVSNPCAWLLNEVTGGSANICQTIADELHAAGQEEGSNCAAPSSGACLENGRVDDDCCIGSGNRYSCASGGDGVLSTSCSLFGAQLLCCNGAGGGGGGGGGDPCQYAGDGECDVPAYCSSGDYVDCGHSCRYDADGECDDGSHGGTAYCDAGTDCGDCHNCHGSGHRRSMLDAFDPKTAKLARPTGSEPWADGAYKGVPVVIYEVVLAAMLKEIGQDQPGGNLPLATVMKNWDKRRLSGGK